MKRTIIVLTLAACSGSNQIPHGDAAIDAPPLSIDCPTYCGLVQTNCSGANVQYADTAHCMATCKSFPVSANATGNTLGCRLRHASNAGGEENAAAIANDCAYASAAGDRIEAPASVADSCSDGNVCTSFCTLEIMACGSLDAPLPGDPRDKTNNSLFQYVNMNDCLNSCGGYDMSHAYSVTATGDSLACRLYQSTDAAIAINPNATNDCIATGVTPSGACAGTPMP